MGLILALGTTALWPVAFGILFVWVLFNFPYKYRLDTLTLTITGLLAVSAIISSDHFTGVYAAGAVFAVSVIAQNAPNRSRIILPHYAILTITLIIGAIQYSNGIGRISPIHLNASLLGMAGLAVSSYTVGGVLVGFSQSRTALLGILLFAMLRNKSTVWLTAIAAVIIFVSLSAITNPVRITVHGFVQSLELRNEALNDTSTEVLPFELQPVTSREWRVFGYGYGGYTLSTGRIQPHNVYVLAWYELGILSIPFWLLIARLWLRSRNYYLLIFVPMAFVVDDFYRINGIFIVCLMHLLTRSMQSPLDTWRLRPHSGKHIGLMDTRNGVKRHG